MIAFEDEAPLDALIQAIRDANAGARRQWWQRIRDMQAQHPLEPVFSDDEIKPHWPATATAGGPARASAATHAAASRSPKKWLTRNRLPVLDQVIRRAPSQRLNGQSWVARAMRGQHRTAQNPQIRNLVRKAPLVHHVTGRVIHAGVA